tara:strand:- start:1007 stop:2074 length:1068 start_codon:yes stop_codon:yes gene_type:complete
MGIDENNSVFKKIKNYNHEQIVFCNDDKIGLKAIIGIHNTTLGPAIGGTRMWDYISDEEALKDVINLSKAMSYKSSLAGLNAGGGKAVIIGNPNIKSEKFIKRFGDFINDLNGKYWTAQDVNMTTQDIVWIKEKCKFVVGLPKEHGGLGDSSSPTAFGVYMGIKSAVKHISGNDTLNNKNILVQGVGNVGRKLVDHLLNENANVFVCEINSKNVDAVRDKKVTIVDPENIYDSHYDIISPCALGGTINIDSLKKINCDIIAGAANNQLENDNEVPEELNRKNILYIPDFLINAGGIISVYHEQINDINFKKVMEMTELIYDKVNDVIKHSEKNSLSTNSSAIQLAKDRIKENSKK